MRTHGNVRFLKITTHMQVAGLTLIAVIALGCLISLGAMAWAQYRAEADLASFQRETAHIATTQERIDAYSSDLEDVVDELRAKQDFLDEMARMLPEDIRETGTNVTDSTAEAAKTVEKIGELVPEARGLAEIEARQLAFAERLTRYADMRAKRAELAMRKLNLDPRQMARNAEIAGGVGGPLELLSTAKDGSLDPRFERLGLSLARLNTLELALSGIPRFAPAKTRVTSSFGYRRDPFNGRAAMHRGMDFAGPAGSPIFAAADGTVTFTGRKSGYGNVVELTHANGMMTRYAHMSRIKTKVGKIIRTGEVIGAIGSTGRSTGAHLHFEVWMNNRAVNPRPFLETAPDVLKEARRAAPLRTTAKTSD